METGVKEEVEKEDFYGCALQWPRAGIWSIGWP